jgi:hypothetical protein
MAWYRRCECTTVGGWSATDTAAAGFVCFAMSISSSARAMLKGASKIISVATGGIISPNWVVVAMTVAFLAYSFFGGLIAAAYTDFIQGFHYYHVVHAHSRRPECRGRLHRHAGSLDPSFFEIYNR